MTLWVKVMGRFLPGEPGPERGRGWSWLTSMSREPVLPARLTQGGWAQLRVTWCGARATLDPTQHGHLHGPWAFLRCK